MEVLHMNRSIVCGLDGSPVSHWAARVAAELARALRLGLVLTHVADDPPTFPYGDRRLREVQRREAIERGSAMLEEIAGTLPVEPAELRVVLGDAVDSLTAMSRDDETELLVVGSRGRRPLAAAMLGSVSGALAAATGCPMIVVPSEEAGQRMLSRLATSDVLCGVDGSAGSIAALAFAADLAEWLQAEVRALHVDRTETWDHLPEATFGPVLDFEVGDPVERLLKRASEGEAALLVVGSPSRGGWRAMAGSVSLELAARAPVPVVIVPATAASLAGVADVVVAGFDDGDR
jgi:nucleotide-binding universal stress UspA family protein